MTNQLKKQKSCYFCLNNINEIDYKDVATMRRFTNMYKKILPRKRTGICTKHQRLFSAAVKRARVMALAQFTNR